MSLQHEVYTILLRHIILSVLESTIILLHSNLPGQKQPSAISRHLLQVSSELPVTDEHCRSPKLPHSDLSRQDFA